MSRLNERYVAMTQKRKHVLMLRYRNICHDGIGQPDQAKRRIAIRFALCVYPQPHPPPLRYGPLWALPLFKCKSWVTALEQAELEAILMMSPDFRGVFLANFCSIGDGSDSNFQKWPFFATFFSTNLRGRRKKGGIYEETGSFQDSIFPFQSTF